MRSAIAGQTCSIALNLLPDTDVLALYEAIKKGAVLTDRTDPPELINEFVVNFNLCNTSEEAMINTNYEPVVFSETFKQTCSIEMYSNQYLKMTRLVSKSKDNIDTKFDTHKKRSKSLYNSRENWDNTLSQTTSDICLLPNADNILLVKFKFKPEYVKLGQKVVIYDNHLKATGVVIELIN